MNTADPDRRRESSPEGHVAIIGMACLFPGAPNLDAYWQNLVEGLDAVSEPPPGARDVPTLAGASEDPIYCWRGGYLGELASFDPLEYGIMPVGLDAGDADQWLTLRIAHEALADAGREGEFTERERTAVVLGKGNYLGRGNLGLVQHGAVLTQTLGVLRSLHPEYGPEELRHIGEALAKSLPAFDADTMAGVIPNLAASRIANRLDLRGPSYTVDAACASSLIATDLAARELREGRCDLALAGGVHLVSGALIRRVFCQVGALSREQVIRPFAADADGTVLGEGVGMVVLKRLADAERDGNRIYAVIRGIGTSSDGRGSSVLAPRLEGEVLAMRRAYAAAEVAPETIGFVEAHGTGTPVGDAVELRAMLQVFGTRPEGAPRCAVGSVKSMLGHLLPAAGIAGLIKAALSLYHKTLPPTLHVAEPSPELDPVGRLYVNTKLRPWVQADPAQPRRAAVSAFGFGGINAHAVLEEAPSRTEAHPTRLRRWQSEICIFGALSREALLARLQEVRGFLETSPEVELRDLAYSLNVPLDPGPCRLAIAAASVEDLAAKLGRTIERLSRAERRTIKDPRGIYYFEEPLGAAGRLAFLFPGEGSQYPDLLADLCVHFPEVRQRFDLADQACREQGAPLLPSELLFPYPTFSPEERAATEERLWEMEGAVCGVLTADYALFTLLNRLRIAPDVVVGHSTGEYPAMLAAGMLDLADGSLTSQFAAELFGVYREAATTEGLPTGSLLAIAAPTERVEQLLRGIDGEVHVAMANCPNQTVVAGSEEAVEALLARCRASGLLTERLRFDRPYHTSLFEPFAQPLRGFFERWLLFPPRIPVYSCATAAPFPNDVEGMRALAVAQWTRPVAFRRTVEAMYRDGVRIFVEVGGRGNLSAFVDDTLRDQPHLAVPADVPTRSGITQLNHLVGLLAAHGVAMELDYLYARRSPRRLSVTTAELTVPNVQRRAPVHLATGWPQANLPPETVAELRRGPPPGPEPGTPRELAPPAQEMAVDTRFTPELPSVPPTLRPSGISGPAQVMAAYTETMERFLAVQEEVMSAFCRGDAPQRAIEMGGQASGAMEAAVAPPVSREPSATPVLSAPEAPDGRSAVPGRIPPRDLLLGLISERTGYPREMLAPEVDLEADLGIDSIKRVEILGSLQQQTGLLRQEDLEELARRRTLREILALIAERERDPAPATAPTQLPFVGAIESRVPGHECVVLRELDLAEDRFLRHHTFGRRVSLLDPELLGVPVMPLTASLEAMAEAAALLVPGERLVGMRAIRAHRWIAPEEGRLPLRITARRVAEGSSEIHVRIQESSGVDAAIPGAALVEGVMLFAPEYSAPPRAGEFPINAPRPPRWPAERLYEDVLFHESLFQGVVAIDALGDDGIRTTVEVLPRSELFASTDDPNFLADPVLHDQLGQVAGFWAYDRAGADCFFPFQVESFEFFGPVLPVGERVECRARVGMIAPDRLRADIEVIRGTGEVWVRCRGWEDRRFNMPPEVTRFTLEPRDHQLSRPWQPTSDFPFDSGKVCARTLSPEDFPPGFFQDAGGMWLRSLCRLAFSGRERAFVRGLPGERLLPLLLGRFAAKDAVRKLLHCLHGLSLCPADIELHETGRGELLSSGAWLEQVPEPPRVVLAQQSDTPVALAFLGAETRSMLAWLEDQLATRPTSIREPELAKP